MFFFSIKLIYSFNQIFDETVNQKQLFEHVGLSLVQDLLKGKNGLLFTNGVSESGKTYTIMGDRHEIGMLQQSLDTLFNSISFQQAKKYVNINIIQINHLELIYILVLDI